MKEKIISYRSVTLLFSLVLASFSFGQLRDVKWEPWQTMPCFNGISVSVLNMGYGKEAGGYLWGIRIRNDYSTPVRLSFKLTIGEENKSSSDFRVTGLLKKGEVWTDGGDVFTANLYKSPSKEYFVVLDKVCFDGMKCGGNDECYADCDAVPGKPNQPCGLNNTANKKNTPVETEEWQAEGNNGQKIKITKLEDTLTMDLMGQYFSFNKISPDEYKYSSGDLIATVVMLSEKRLLYSFKNLTHSEYNYDIFYKRISTSPVNKKVFSGNAAGNFEDCLWSSLDGSTMKYRLIKTDGGYLLTDQYNTPNYSSAFSKVGENQYQYLQKSYGTAADILRTLSIVNDYLFEINSVGGQHPGMPVGSYKATYLCLTALENAGKWTGVNNPNDVVNIMKDENGAYVRLFNEAPFYYSKIDEGVYQYNEGGTCAECRRFVVRFTANDHITVELYNRGQMTDHKEFVRSDK